MFCCRPKSLAAVHALHSACPLGGTLQDSPPQTAHTLCSTRADALLQAEGSGWTAPLALDSADTARDKVETHPVKLRILLPGQGVLHEVVAQLDLVGGKFARTMVRPLKPPR